jgi:hypothetical protein
MKFYLEAKNRQMDVQIALATSDGREKAQTEMHEQAYPVSRYMT